jgi:iron complex transport system substrate-binding protein
MKYPVAVVLALQSFADAVTFPVGITNCGIQSWIAKPPQRAVTMNQGTTEIMLALNLTDHMVGTAYLDDEIWSEVAEAYTKVPILSDTYPDIDTLMKANPDFVYASYKSAFQNGTSIHYSKHLGECDLTSAPENGDGPNTTYCRQELHDEGIQTYLQGPYCEFVEHQPADGTSVQVLYDEIWEIATIFNVPDEARTLIDSIEDHFEQAKRVSEKSNPDIPPIRILWLDGWDEESPFVGACCGSVNLIIESAGATNVFDDLGVDEKSSWESATWDDIEKLDPDLIVLVDASWDLAGEKRTCFLAFFAH